MKRAWVELALVVLTGAAHLAFENMLDLKGPFIAGAGLAWTAYMVGRLRTSGQARAWGMRADTLGPSLVADRALPAAAMVAYGLSQARTVPSAGLFYLLALIRSGDSSSSSC